ncbi:MAG: Crp/Fnr family transcriptional regulator [Terrimicrobiaceae bacterium]
MKKKPLSAGLPPLKNAPLFHGLSAPQKSALAEITSVRSFRRNEIIFREGAPATGFFVIQSGAVNVHRLSPDGSERIIRIFHSGESFAEASLLPGGVYPANARALGDCSVCLISRAPFLSLLESDSHFALRMIVALSVRIHALAGSIENLRVENMRERLLLWLLSRRPTEGNPISYTIYLATTKAALAAELGMRQETLSRLLADLRASGNLAVNGREIVVLKPARLRALLNETES